MAAKTPLESVAAFGIYGRPKPAAAAVAVREVRQWLAAHEWPQTVMFAVFDEESRQHYELALAG